MAGARESVIQTGVILNLNNEAIRWLLYPGRTPLYMPDNTAVWDYLWENREDISGIAHTHSGDRITISENDVKTFAAIERGLRKCLKWWIVTESSIQMYKKSEDFGYEKLSVPEPKWTSKLRELSRLGLETRR
jgi:hypothetical protein